MPVPLFSVACRNASQLGRNAHVYVDDIVVKTEKRGTLLEDLRETFDNLRRFQIKLNPE